MIENIVLGTVQGISEWLPFSSDGVIALVKISFFGGTNNLENLTKIALFLHLGTFLAALIYFRQDVWRIIKNLFFWKKISDSEKKIIKFLFIATIISGILGVFLIKVLSGLLNHLGWASKIFTIIIGGLLILTALWQIKNRRSGARAISELTKLDYILGGLAQGLSVLPGLSRSGLTVSSLLFRGFDKKEALRLSFLMSLPIILGGNLILLLDGFKITVQGLVGVLTAFVAGILTINLLFKLAQKINFGYFVLLFGCLTIIAGLFL